MQGGPSNDPVRQEVTRGRVEAFSGKKAPSQAGLPRPVAGGCPCTRRRRLHTLPTTMESKNTGQHCRFNSLVARSISIYLSAPAFSNKFLHVLIDAAFLFFFFFGACLGRHLHPIVGWCTPARAAFDDTRGLAVNRGRRAAAVGDSSLTEQLSAPCCLSRQQLCPFSRPSTLDDDGVSWDGVQMHSCPQHARAQHPHPHALRPSADLTPPPPFPSSPAYS